MALTCSRCGRINPKDAAFCYFDGIPVAAAGGAAAVRPGQKSFPNPFVFPAGTSCQNFDQLMTACQKFWTDARELLGSGAFEQFFFGMGRADLATFAQSASLSADLDRGLDQLLGRLPSSAVPPPRLQTEPTQINLGSVKAGTDRTFEIHLTNLGGRLLYGQVTSTVPWLTLGDAPGAPQKIVQCTADMQIPVQLRGAQLRAGDKPQEAQLTIETNGGNAQVLVRLEVPVQSFPEGVLAGARTPRELAHKAKQTPREAAVLFERGIVAAWYKANGWDYPVRGEAASGIAAVQQFFEALGLTKPPKVSLSQQDMTFAGQMGQTLEASFLARTDEKRHLYVHAVSDQPWLLVKSTRVSNTNTRIHAFVRIPPNTEPIIQGNITVSANGNQKFVVPVTLSIRLGTAGPVKQAQKTALANKRVATLIAPSEPQRADTPPLAGMAAALPTANGAPLPPDDEVDQLLADVGIPRSKLQARKTRLAAAAAAAPPDDEEPPSRALEPSVVLLLQLVPSILLAMMLGFVLLHDLLLDKNYQPPVEQHGNATIRINPAIEEPPLPDAELDVDPKPRLLYKYDPGKRFGLFLAGSNKRLTFADDGGSNNTVLSFGKGFYRPLGRKNDGRWVSAQEAPRMPNGDNRVDLRSKNVWEDSATKIRVTQVLDIVPSKQPVTVAPGVRKRLLDTCLVAYLLENTSTKEQVVGLRLLLDTFIGDNDGVPFTVAGVPELVSTFADYRYRKGQSDVPDFLQALESGDPLKPGTIANLTIRVGSQLEPPGRVSLTQYPGGEFHKWDVPMVPINEDKQDSAVVLYWYEATLRPGEKRALGFAYGLGLAEAATGIVQGPSKLSLAFDGSFEPRDVFTLLARVENPAPGQTLSLTLPAGLKVLEGGLKQRVPSTEGKSVVTWRILVERAGEHALEVRASSGATQRRTLFIPDINARQQQQRHSVANIFR